VTERFSGMAASMWQVTMRLVRSGGIVLTSRLVVSTMGAYRPPISPSVRTRSGTWLVNLSRVTSSINNGIAPMRSRNPSARLAVNWPERIIFSKPNIDRAAMRVNRVLPALDRPYSTA